MANAAVNKIMADNTLKLYDAPDISLEQASEAKAALAVASEMGNSKIDIGLLVDHRDKIEEINSRALIAVSSVMLSNDVGETTMLSVDNVILNGNLSVGRTLVCDEFGTVAVLTEGPNDGEIAVATISSRDVWFFDAVNPPLAF